MFDKRRHSALLAGARVPAPFLQIVMKINNKAIVAIIILLALILAVCVAIFVVLVNNDKAQENEEQTTSDEVADNAKQSAFLQEATAIFKEAYALDLSDGELDAKENGVDITTVGDKSVTYTVTDGNIVFIYADDGYTASYNGSDWTIEVDTK